MKQLCVILTSVKFECLWLGGCYSLRVTVNVWYNIRIKLYRNINKTLNWVWIIIYCPNATGHNINYLYCMMEVRILMSCCLVWITRFIVATKCLKYHKLQIKIFNKCLKLVLLWTIFLKWFKAFYIILQSPSIHLQTKWLYFDTKQISIRFLLKYITPTAPAH